MTFVSLWALPSEISLSIFADSLIGRFSDFQIQNIFWKYPDDHVFFVIKVI